MKSLLIQTASIASALAVSLNGFVFAAENDDTQPAAEPVIRAATTIVFEVRLDEEAAEVRPVVEKVAAPGAEGPAEALNLEVLAAPIEALFGIGGNGLVPAVPQAVLANDDAMVQQFVQQLRPVLTEELNFIRLVCSDLTPPQRAKVKAAADDSIMQAAKSMAEMQNPQVRRAGRGGRQARAAVAEPRSMVREAMAKALQETLTKERMAQFNSDSVDRQNHRKHAAILGVVSRLDGCLFLNEQQRTKIIDAISSNWQEKWEQWLMMSSYGDQYFPVLPDQYVTAHLDANQKLVWQGLQKIELGGWWGNQNQFQQNDGWWGDDPAAVAVPQLNGVIFLNN